MNADTRQAKKCFEEGTYTCVLYRGDSVYTSRERGVKPLLDWLDQKVPLDGYSGADKVIGQATAYLYVQLGIAEVYTPVASESAYQVLKQNGVSIIADRVVPEIRNRMNTGGCPMEAAVRDCRTSEEAVSAIRNKLRELKNGR